MLDKGAMYCRTLILGIHGYPSEQGPTSKSHQSENLLPSRREGASSPRPSLQKRIKNVVIVIIKKIVAYIGIMENKMATTVIISHHPLIAGEDPWLSTVRSWGRAHLSEPKLGVTSIPQQWEHSCIRASQR